MYQIHLEISWGLNIILIPGGGLTNGLEEDWELLYNLQIISNALFFEVANLKQPRRILQPVDLAIFHEHNSGSGI